MLPVNQLIWLYFGASGRLSRGAYFWAGLLTFVLLFFPAYQFLLSTVDGAPNGFWLTISWAVSFMFLWWHVALGIKRLHDIGKPGYVAFLIPLFVALAFIVLAVMPGEEGPNRYGVQTNRPK
ncbi:MAG: DUF805 domain-containing protein [Rhizobiaceae bacterium]|nr:DUF805 domain-containing protein [Rhizobiaceae bacterium]